MLKKRMEVMHRVLYIQGIGPEPEVQATLPEDWGMPNLTLEHLPFDWTLDDYEDRKRAAGAYIADRAAGDEKIHLLAASAGGMALADLLATYGEDVESAAAINAKMSQLDPTSSGWQTFANLVLANAALPGSLERLGTTGRGKLLIVHSKYDERIKVEDMKLAGAAGVVPMKVSGHIKGIEYALTAGKDALIGYFLHRIIPRSV